MIERIEIASEALPWNGVDAGFRNRHDRDFQRACLDAVEEILRRVFAIHRDSLGALSAKIECLDDGFAGRVVELPGEMSDEERSAWGGHEAGIPESGSLEAVSGFRYAVLALVFEGRDFIRIGFLLATPESEDARFKSMVSTCGIIASRAVQLEELRYLSRHDGLTGLASRDLFLKRIADEIARLQPGAPEAVLFEVRLACLGEVNDNFGFPAGDELILETARRLSAINHGKTFVARVGGSKFMLLVRPDGQPKISSLMRAVEDALDSPVRIEGLDMRMNVDIGCVALDDPRLQPVEVLQRAETAVSDARSRSVMLRQKAYVYSDAFFEAKKRNSRQNLMVRQAHRENRFFLLFQPLVDLRKRAVVGCEALLRLRDNHGLRVEAARFMAAVSRIRYQSTLDKWVFAEILRSQKNNNALRRRMESGGFVLAMNCDPGLLAQKRLARKWLGVFEREGFDPRSLMLEVVENPILFKNTELVKNLRALRAEGVRIAIDDFGSGYSNLRHLADLPVDIVKFDRGFLKGLAAAVSKGGELLKTMLDLCSRLGYETVCEGVETQDHADFLASVDCRCAQGYFYGRPMPMADVLSLTEKYDVPAGTMETGNALE